MDRNETRIKSYFSVIATACLCRSGIKWLWCELTPGPSSYGGISSNQVTLSKLSAWSPSGAPCWGLGVQTHEDILHSNLIQFTFHWQALCCCPISRTFCEFRSRILVNAWPFPLLGYSPSFTGHQIHYQLLFTHQLADSRFLVVLYPLACSLNCG